MRKHKKSIGGINPQQRPTSTRTDSQERWRQILDVSSDLFRRKGYTGTSMNDISEAVGLLKGSLYYYIRSKEDLLFGILKGLHDDGEDIIASVKFDSGDPIGQLQLYLKKEVIFACRNAKRLSIFLRDFENVPPARRSAIISKRDMYVLTAERLIQEALEKGIIAPSLNPHMAATLIMGATAGTHEWLRADGPLPLEEVAGQIAHMLTEGLAGPGSVKHAQPVRARRSKNSQRSRLLDGGYGAAMAGQGDHEGP
jgi:TetR/AcrR family transcriptional regulator, cholesterol catabolism regulator